MAGGNRGARYLVGPLNAPFTYAMAATLAYGGQALLSHHSAAVVWGVCPTPLRGIHVTVRSSTGVHSRHGVTAHRCRDLDAADAARHSGIPVTSPARTLLDLAAHVPQRELSRAVEEARVHQLVTDRSLNEQFSRHPRHPGSRALRSAIQAEPALTRSEAERLFLELIRKARLPEPQANVRVGRHEVDFFWPEHELIFEIDGYAFHSTRGAFERDRRRDADLGAHGHRVMRATWRQLIDEPEALVATIALAYGQRMRGAR